MLETGPLAESEIDSVTDYIINQLRNHRIITFTGDLGAGKTTLINNIVRKMGVKGEANSPTFGLINEYELPDGRLICHTDWYRIRDLSELLDAGMTEYIYHDQCLVLIEWPEIGMHLIEDENPLHVSIAHLENKRNYRFSSGIR